MRRGNVLAHVVGTDGKLTVATVDHHGELHGLGAAQVNQGIERRANRAAGVEHVVDEHDVDAVDGEQHLGGIGHRVDVTCVVIAIEADVKLANLELDALDGLDLRCKTLRDGDSAPLDADERDTVCALVMLDDFVSDARDGSVHRQRVHDLGFQDSLFHGTPS